MGSARRTKFYLKTHNIYEREREREGEREREKTITMMRFEPVIPANEWTQTQTLDAAATGIGLSYSHDIKQNNVKG